MKKFGFGRSSKNSSPAPTLSNPYAQQPSIDTYPKENINSSSSSSYGVIQNTGLQNGPGTAQSSNMNAGYGADRYGNGGGYGANRYDTTGPGSSADYKYSAIGNGTMANRNSVETTTTEENRDALFGGAKDRYAQRALPVGNGRPAGGYTGGYGDDRQLTREEEEEEEVAATKQDIRSVKQESVTSTQRALAIAAQAEETGRATLARLGAQSERLHNTEKHLDLASNHNRAAEEKARELKTLNRSMFAVHVSNPFTSSSRRAARDEEIHSKHKQEREQREATRQAAFTSRQRMEGSLKDVQNGDASYQYQTKASLAERSKYQFEADSEDEEMENQIDRNIDALAQANSRLNALARATGKEVEEQNKHIDRIISKSDRVDDQITMNKARLNRIK